MLGSRRLPGRRLPPAVPVPLGEVRPDLILPPQPVTGLEVVTVDRDDGDGCGGVVGVGPDVELLAAPEPRGDGSLGEVPSAGIDLDGTTSSRVASLSARWSRASQRLSVQTRSRNSSAGAGGERRVAGEGNSCSPRPWSHVKRRLGPGSTGDRHSTSTVWCRMPLWCLGRPMKSKVDSASRGEVGLALAVVYLQLGSHQQ